MRAAERKITQAPTPTEIFELDPNRLIQYIERGLHHGYGVLGKHLKELEMLSGHVLKNQESAPSIEDARYYRPADFTNTYSLIDFVKMKKFFAGRRF